MKPLAGEEADGQNPEMAHPLFPSEFPLDARRVGRILATRFPGLEPVSIRLLGEGWDYTAFEANGVWVFRFPKREREQARSEMERIVLSDLAPRLPLPVPVPELLGDPGEDFPWSFWGYRKIEGVEADSVSVPEGARAGLAEGLGRFLSALHAYPADRVREAGGSSEGRREALAEERREALDHLAVLGDEETAARVERVLREPSSSPPPWPYRPVTIHLDLLPEHLLLTPDGARIAGVIDWGDLGVGDPASEFARVVLWLGPKFVKQILRHYAIPRDDAFERRISHWALPHAVNEAHFNLHADQPARAERSLRVVGEVLAEIG